MLAARWGACGRQRQGAEHKQSVQSKKSVQRGLLFLAEAGLQRAVYRVAVVLNRSNAT